MRHQFRSQRQSTVAASAMGRPHRSLRPRTRGRLASALIASVILIVIAGFITLSWVAFVTHSMESATRDRERLAAAYAAESGIELVIDWMNHPEHFEEFLAATSSLNTRSGEPLVRRVPTTAITYIGPDKVADRREILLDWAMPHPVRYPLEIPGVRTYHNYSPFEPYVRDYVKDYDGTPLSKTAEPIYSKELNTWISPHTSKDLVTTVYTFFLPGPGNNDLFEVKFAGASERSKVPSMVIAFDDASNMQALRAIMPHREFRLGRDTQIANTVGAEIARLESIELIHPTQFDVPESVSFGVVTKVVATGISQSGIRTTVECLLIENRIPNISSPGAILAPSGVVFNSNINIHWGEIWTHEDSLLVSNWNNHMPVYDPSKDFGPYKGQSKWDPWFRYRTRGVFKDSTNTLFADIRQDGGFGPNQVPETQEPYFRTPFFWSSLRGKSTSSFQYYHNMQQNQSITIMSRQYEDWKELFQEYNLPYYYTDVNGNVWGRENDQTSPQYGEYVAKDYASWFHCDPADPNYWEFDYLFAFIDSVPRNDQGQPTTPGVIDDEFYPRDPTKPPAINWPDAGMSTVKDSGQSTHTRGVMFSATNLDMTGSGTPPSWKLLKFSDGSPMVTMPDGRTPDESLLRKNQQDITISHNGLMHTWGKMKNGGNRTIYGSIHAERGLVSDPDYGAGGTPSVWYNYRMADGSWLSLNQSRVRRSHWDIAETNIVLVGG
jgi:hypothetical protein